MACSTGSKPFSTVVKAWCGTRTARPTIRTEPRAFLPPAGPAGNGMGHPDPIAAIDLFAGAGGLSLGLEAAGFTPAAAVEWCPDASATYRAHHPAATVIQGDITALDFKGRAGTVRSRGRRPAVPAIFCRR